MIHLINWRLFWVESLNGLTLAALYFTVASGFTLIFGLMRVVNMAHGSLYLLGAYVGYEVQLATGSWVAGLAAGALTAAALGVVLQQVFFSWMQGQDLRQALVSIGISIVLADLMLWQWGGETYQLSSARPFERLRSAAGRASLPDGAVAADRGCGLRGGCLVGVADPHAVGDADPCGCG